MKTKQPVFCFWGFFTRKQYCSLEHCRRLKVLCTGRASSRGCQLTASFPQVTSMFLISSRACSKWRASSVHRRKKPREQTQKHVSGPMAQHLPRCTVDVGFEGPDGSFILTRRVTKCLLFHQLET